MERLKRIAVKRVVDLRSVNDQTVCKAKGVTGHKAKGSAYCSTFHDVGVAQAVTLPEHT